MTTRGYLSFASGHFRSGLILDGHAFEGAAKPLNMAAASGIATGRSQVGTVFSQSLWRGGDEPQSVTPAEGSLSFTLRTEEDKRRLDYSLGRSQPAELFFGMWLSDVWSVAGAPGAQTAWRTSRPAPYHLSAVDRAVLVPRVHLVDSSGVEAEQTVLDSGTPSAGEAVFPDAGGGGYATVTTPAASTLSAYSELVAWYPALFRARLGYQWEVAEVNGLRVEVSFEEVLSGEYNPA